MAIQVSSIDDVKSPPMLANFSIQTVAHSNSNKIDSSLRTIVISSIKPYHSRPIACLVNHKNYIAKQVKLMYFKTPTNDQQ